MRIYLNPCFSRYSFDKSEENKEKMPKAEQNFNQSCDSSNGSASIEERKVNSVNTDHENFAMDDAYRIDESLTMEYRGHTQNEVSDKRRKYILAGAVVVLALLLLAGVIAFICVYVKRENDNQRYNSNKDDCDTKDNKNGDCNTDDKKNKDKNTNETDDNVCYTKKCKTIAAYLKKTMNMSADPCENFHEYACGNWAVVHPLPASMAKLDTMGLLNLRKMAYLKKVIEQESRNTHSSRRNSRGFKAKILTYYKSCMDLDVIDKKNKKPLLDLISRLGGWSPTSSWIDEASVISITDLLIKTHRYFTPSVVDDTIRSPLFKSIVKVNDRNSSEHILEFNLPNFPLSDTRDFIATTKRANTIRAKYKLLKTNYVALLGPSPNAEELINRISDFELKLANISIKQSEYRNVYQQYHFTTVAKFTKYVGTEIDWLKLINGIFSPVNIGVTEDLRIGVRSIDFFKSLDDLIKQTDVQIVKDYIIWVCVWRFGSYASAPFREANYNFQRALLGIEERPKQWWTCITDIEQTMEFGLTSLYVKKALTDEDKIMASEIVRNVTREFKKNLVNVEWMDVSTKAAAFEKVDSIAGNIGYPNFVKNETYLDILYIAVKIYPKEYFKNILSMYEQKRFNNLELLNRIVDRTVYDLPPTLVEAYFDPNKNKMVFLAGILHAPFYDNQRPMALNYGALGLVAGHEVTHAFDDLGGQFDGKGEKKNWWSDSSLNQFRKRSSCMKYQYGNYTIFGENVNGINTLGENIADNGGIKVAYMGYKEWERTHGKEKLLPGISLNMDQLFFVSHGQVWCGAYRKEYIKMSLNVDYHSPSKFRIIGPLSNLKQFSDTFNCKLGTPMNPVSKCRVW